MNTGDQPELVASLVRGMQSASVKKAAEADLDSPATLARKAEVAWVGKLHTEAMQEFRDIHKTGTVASAESRASTCASIQRLALKYAARVDSTLGMMRTPAASLANVRAALNATPSCGQAGTMSLFAPSSSIASLSALISQAGDEVDGGFVPYAEAMKSATDYATTPQDVYNATQYIVNQAAGNVSSNDFQVVLSQQSLINDSAADWYTSVGGGGGGGLEPPEEPYSMYAAMLPRWGRIAGADALGCAAGALSTWYAALTPVGWPALAGQCAIWGVTGSMAAAM